MSALSVKGRFVAERRVSSQEGRTAGRITQRDKGILEAVSGACVTLFKRLRNVEAGS